MFRKAMQHTILAIVGVIGMKHFAEMIALIIKGEQVDPITLYIVLGACIGFSIKLVIESVLGWFNTMKGVN